MPSAKSLLGALSRAEEEASAMVVAGRPDRFCAGFDLRVIASRARSSRERR
ncbi:hypothetical protein WMF39_35485 [Sorangium sp. So ce1504]|uniref:hypothetical protein n=1 Tax=Sorangium sp. So ce1504 TaxID=3133337 RepID=UPI003F62A921